VSAARSRTIGTQLALAAVGALLLLLALGFGTARTPERESSGQRSLRTAIENASADSSAASEARAGEASNERAGEAGPEDRAGESVRSRAGLWLPLAGAAHRAAGWIGVLSLQWSLCFFGVLALFWALRPRLGSVGAVLWIAIGLFGSALALATTYLVPELFSFFCAALAGALVWGRRTLPTVEPEQVFQGELSDRRALWRWPVAGLAFGLALGSGPALVPLAVPFVAAARPSRRAPAGGLFVLGAAVALLIATLVTGWPWAPLGLGVDPHLLGWNAVFLFAGRSLGLLPFFLPTFIAVLEPVRDEGRRWIPWCALAGLLVQTATSPFDLAGDSGAPLLASFLPIYALLLLLPSGAKSRWGWAVALVALPWLAAGWLDAAGLREAGWTRPLEPVRRLLPLETTQRELDGVATLDRASGIVLRGLEPEVFPGGDGRLRLFGRRATLVVESTVPLSSIRLELGEGAPSAYEVSGGELGDVLFRPNGEVAVDVQLGKATRRHPTWRSPDGAAVAVIELGLPEAPVAPIPLDLSLARPEGLGGEAP